VVSVAGDTFYRAYTGLTVFNNELEVRDIGEWGLDRQFAESARLTLTKLGMTVAEPAEAPAAFKAVNGTKVTGWGGEWAAVEQASKDYCSARSVDALLLIGRARVGDFLMQGSNQTFGGVGVYGRGPVGPAGRLHVIAQMGMINCQTGKPVATKLVTVFPAQRLSDQVMGLPMLTISPALAEQPMASWSADQWQFFRKSLGTLANGAFDTSIRHMFTQP